MSKPDLVKVANQIEKVLSENKLNFYEGYGVLESVKFNFSNKVRDIGTMRNLKELSSVLEMIVGKKERTKTKEKTKRKSKSKKKKK